MVMWIALGLLVLALLYAVIVYNRLVRLRALVKEGFRGITANFAARATWCRFSQHVEGMTPTSARCSRKSPASPVPKSGNGGHRPGGQRLRRHARTAMAVAEDFRTQGRRQFPTAPGRAFGSRSSAGRSRYYNATSGTQHKRPSFPSDDAGRWASARARLEDGYASIQTAKVRLRQGRLMRRLLLTRSRLCSRASRHGRRRGRILNYLSDVAVRGSGTRDVTETIESNPSEPSDQALPRFPDRTGIVPAPSAVGFERRGVTRNGWTKPTRHAAGQWRSSRIGDAEIHVPTGGHVYSIIPDNPQIGVFDG